MKDIYSKTNCSFVILIDEWDCLFREFQQNYNAQKKYLDFLRVWLKDKDYVALAYMTGILPIKKYGSHSALNMFTEYSMTDPGDLAEYFGFTEQETSELCKTYEALKIYIQMDMGGLKDSVIKMLSGEAIPINVGTFSNDMTTFATKDDVFCT